MHQKMHASLMEIKPHLIALVEDTTLALAAVRVFIKNRPLIISAFRLLSGQNSTKDIYVNRADELLLVRQELELSKKSSQERINDISQQAD